MPDLDTDLHREMLKVSRQRDPLLRRLIKAVKRELFDPPLYGYEWGDPERVPPLKFVRDRYVMPLVKPESTIVEIGPGGGRWTRYLLPCRELWVVDYYEELLAELRGNIKADHVKYVHNNGTDFPGIPDGCADLVFSFGTFVHLDFHLIEGYLENIPRVLKPDGQVFLQYGDKNKVMAQARKGFAENTPERMRAAVQKAGFVIEHEDTTSLWHSATMLMRRA